MTVRVGKLAVGYHQGMVLGEIYPEIGFITQAALDKGGVEIENTGSEPLEGLRYFGPDTFDSVPNVGDA